MATHTQERRQMARTLRRFAAGQITVDQFEIAWDETSDQAAQEAGNLAWSCYVEFKVEGFQDEWQLTPEQRKHWAKWILFLMTSEADYENKCDKLYRERSKWKLQQLLKLKWPAPTPYDATIQELTNIWPFESQADFEKSKSLPNPFLAKTEIEA